MHSGGVSELELFANLTYNARSVEVGSLNSSEVWLWEVSPDT